MREVQRQEDRKRLLDCHGTAALTPISALVLIATLLPMLIWTSLLRLPRFTSLSLQEFAGRASAGSLENDKAVGSPVVTGLKIAPSGLRYQELSLQQFFHTSEVVKVKPRFDYKKLVNWVAERTKDYQGPAPLTVDDFLYHNDSPVGVRLEAGAFADRDRFSIDQNRSLKGYFGILHAHTESSDGKGSVADAYVTGRDIAGLDFMAVTDHPEAWRVKGGPGDTSWQQVRGIATANTRPDFLGLAGFEYSSLAFGHFTVLNTPSYRDSVLDYSLRDFYEWLAHPAQDGAIVFFNHPGFHIYRRPFEFAHFDLDKRLTETIIGLEVLHRNSAYEYMRGYTQAMPYLDEAILKGWTLGAVGGQDNHRGSWGLQDSVRVVPLLSSLDKEQLLSALRQRRFYATQSQDLQFTVEARGESSPWVPMGSHLIRAQLGRSPLQVRVAFGDPTGRELPRRLEVLSAGRVIGEYVFSAAAVEKMRPPPQPDLATPEERRIQSTTKDFIRYDSVDTSKLRGYGVVPDFYPRAGEWRFEIEPPFDVRGAYFYVRFYQGNDADVFTQSSPIWID